MFGISFGSKKTSSSETMAQNKDSIVSGTQQQTSNQSGSTSSTGTTTGTQQQAGTQNTNQTQDQSQHGTTTGRTTGTTQTLGTDVQSALSEKIKSILGGGALDAGITQLHQAISGASHFDPSQMVNDIVAGARNRGEQGLQESTSAFASRAGGTASTNSMSSLIAARGRNDLEANIAGIRGQAEGQAAQIANQNISAVSGATGQIADIAGGLAQTLKGANTTVDMTQLQDQISQLIGKDSSFGKTAASSASSEAKSTQTNELLTQIASILSNQHEQTAASGTSTSNSKSGGGFSLSF